MMRRPCALLLALATCALPALATSPLPRVFFTPQERAAITAMRRAGPEPNAAVTIAATDPAQRANSTPAPVARLDGISLARTGGHFAWIGGRRYADGAAFGRWQLRISRNGVALLRHGRVERQLRVGEALGRDAGATAAP